MSLPDTKQRWASMVQTEGLASEKITHGQHTASGSKIKLKQFLLLQVLWESRKLVDEFYCKDLAYWPDQGLLEKAQEHLKPARSEANMSEPASAWEHYLHAIKHDLGSDPSDLKDLGQFMVVRKMQLPLNKTVMVPLQGEEDEDEDADSPPAAWMSSNPSYQPVNLQPHPSTPTSRGRSDMEMEMDIDVEVDSMDEDSPLSDRPSVADVNSPMKQAESKLVEGVKDEQIVNTSLIVFLETLIAGCSAVYGQWTPDRYQLILRDPVKGEKIFESQVDGYLERNEHEQPFAIIEVKPYIRYGPGFDQTRMQEGAEMALWIFQHPPDDLEKCRAEKTTMERLLVSQDRHEIYLTIAEFKAEYVDYLRGDAASGKAFLTMREYGPFDVFNESNMRQLGKILLAFSMMHCPAPSSTPPF